MVFKMIELFAYWFMLGMLNVLLVFYYMERNPKQSKEVASLTPWIMLGSIVLAPLASVLLVLRTLFLFYHRRL